MSTRSKYRKVPSNENKEGENSEKYEIRVSVKRSPNSYIIRSAVLLLEDKEDFVILKAAGNAISKALLVSEIVRRRIAGLH